MRAIRTTSLMAEYGKKSQILCQFRVWNWQFNASVKCAILKPLHPLMKPTYTYEIFAYVRINRHCSVKLDGVYIVNMLNSTCWKLVGRFFQHVACLRQQVANVYADLQRVESKFPFEYTIRLHTFNRLKVSVNMLNGQSLCLSTYCFQYVGNATRPWALQCRPSSA